MLFVSGVALFSTTSTITASGDYGDFHQTYQLKKFSDINSANKFMHKHGGSTLVGYDRKTESEYSGEVDEDKIYNADEKFIVQYRSSKVEEHESN